MSSVINKVREVKYLVVKTMPFLDAIEAGVDLVQDPSLKRLKRMVATYRRLAR